MEDQQSKQTNAAASGCEATHGDTPGESVAVEMATEQSNSFRDFHNSFRNRSVRFYPSARGAYRRPNDPDRIKGKQAKKAAKKARMRMKV